LRRPLRESSRFLALTNHIGGMRKRRRFWLVILILATMGGLGWLLMSALDSEPVYQGKRLDQWLEEYDQAGSMDKTAPISDAIRAMGTNCLPFLLAHIKHTDSPLKLKFVAMVRRFHLGTNTLFGMDNYHSTSVMALGALGSNAAPLCPELLKVAEDTNTLWWGQMSLLAIGPAAIPTLEKVCQSTNAKARTEAVLMMAMQKDNGAPWFSWGWNKGPDGRKYFSLGYAVSDEDIRAMVKMLEHPDAAVRRASAEAIGVYAKSPAYGNAMKSAIAPLIKALKDPDAEVRFAAAQTLKAIDPDAAAKAGVK
jgi:HEAT repeat protein